MHTECPFCGIDPSRILQETELAIALTDGFPVSTGHALIVPKRHIASWFDSTDDERAQIFSLLDDVRDQVRRTHSAEGFNIGINDGPAAGQTVLHLHVHLIPRYVGDLPDPRGGVRWILPAKADYWSSRK